MALGIAAFEDDAIITENCRIIAANRENTVSELKKLGFDCTRSQTNFIFARHPEISGQRIYELLREKGILVRHFTSKRICEYNRITVGSEEQMQALVNSLKEIISQSI